MRSLHNLPRRIARDFSRLVRARLLNAAPVVLAWDAAPPPGDENVEADLPAPEPVTATVNALVHFVTARSVMRGYAEFQAGDAIITFGDAELRAAGLGDDLGALRDLRFSLGNGRTYVQAAAGKRVAEFWGIFVGGQPLARTVLVRESSSGNAAAA